jgi:hypothetical protein
VAGLTLAEADNRLAQALTDLPDHAAPLVPVVPAAIPTAARADGVPGPRWQLALDEIRPTGAELRPRLPLPAGHELSGPRIQAPSAAAPAALIALTLDVLTATQDPAFAKTLALEANLTDAYRTSLAAQLT